MLSKPTYAVILDEDRARSLSLRHMFTVICGKTCEVYESLSDVFDNHCEDSAPTVLVLGSVPQRADVLREVSDKNLGFVVVLEHEGDELGVEDAFLLGADEVLRAPLSLRELALSLRVRIGMLDSLQDNDLFLDSANWGDEAYIAERAGLTESEAQVVHILIRHSGKIVSRDALSLAIDGRAWDYGDRKFDVHVAKNRKKLISTFGDHISVQTVRSAGYILSIDDIGHRDLSQSVG